MSNRWKALFWTRVSSHHSSQNSLTFPDHSLLSTLILWMIWKISHLNWSLWYYTMDRKLPIKRLMLLSFTGLCKVSTVWTEYYYRAIFFLIFLLYFLAPSLNQIRSLPKLFPKFNFPYLYLIHPLTFPWFLLWLFPDRWTPCKSLLMCICITQNWWINLVLLQCSGLSIRRVLIQCSLL